MPMFFQKIGYKTAQILGYYKYDINLTNVLLSFLSFQIIYLSFFLLSQLLKFEIIL